MKGRRSVKKEVQEQKKFEDLMASGADCGELSAAGYIRIYEKGEDIKKCKCKTCLHMYAWHRAMKRKALGLDEKTFEELMNEELTK